MSASPLTSSGADTFWSSACLPPFLPSFCTTSHSAGPTDTAFSTPEHQLVKFNPLADYSSEDIWNYIRMLEIPYNPLHEKGFISIGCEPCTRPVLPNQHEREGRWWWEESTKKECGLHAGNLIARS